jgi:hypothetical protein
MVAELKKSNKPAGNTCDIDAEIKLTRLKIVYLLKHDPHNSRILRIALYRYAWLLFTRQFACNFLNKDAVRAYEIMEHLLARILPACPGGKTTRI